MSEHPWNKANIKFSSALFGIPLIHPWNVEKHHEDLLSFLLRSTDAETQYI